MGTHFEFSVSQSQRLLVIIMAVAGSSNVEEEYLWTCILDASNKEFSWNPEDPSDVKDDDEADPSVKPGHRLLVKSALLMPSAKKDEVTIVQIEGDGYNKGKVVVPIVAMKGGSDHQMYVDLLIPCPAKLSLLQGEGPIHLVGSHCVDFYGYRDTGAGDDDDEEDENTEDDADMKEAEDLVKDAKGDSGTPSKDKKTPAKEDKAKTPAKEDKAKTPAKEDEKKWEASDDVAKSGEKKKKESPAK